MWLLNSKDDSTLMQMCQPCVIRMYVNPLNCNDNSLTDMCCHCVFRKYVNHQIAVIID